MNQKQATHIKTIKKSDYRRDNQTNQLASEQKIDIFCNFMAVSPDLLICKPDTAKFIDNVQQALITEKQT